MRATTMLVCGLFGLPAAFAQAQVPRPARAPKSWELDFTYNDPRRMTLTLPGDDEATTFWYMIYRVENHSGQDIQFFPSAELVSDSLEVVKGGELISPTVYDAIIERHKRTDPFLVAPGQAMGTLLQGEDNAKISMVVFRQFNPNDNAFTIYFGGLSGEIKRVLNPRYRRGEIDTETEPQYFTLRKTLALKYKLPGDPMTRGQAEPQRQSREWVMR